MARPIKQGLDYFTFDVNVDDKIKLIEAEFGLQGFAIVVKLFQKIYGGFGYYCEFTYEVALLFGRENGLGGNVVSEIVLACIKRGIFNKDLYKKYSILTSVGIQKRYFKAMERRTKIDVENEYLLLSDVILQDFVNINLVNVNKNLVNVNKSTQSKVKESKVNKSKVNKSIVNKSIVKESSYSEVVDFYHSICISFPKVSKITDKRQRAIRALLNKYNIEIIKDIFKKAENSMFLKGEKGWVANFDWIIKESNFIKILEGIYDKNYRKNALKQDIKTENKPDKQWLDYMEKELERINGQ